MSDFVSYNQNILPAESASVSAVSSAALYGRGIFTTIAIHGSTPFLWEKHWERLTENAARIGISLNEFSERATKKSLLEIIARNSLTRGRARLTFFDESPTVVWQIKQKSKTGLLIQTAQFRPVPDVFRLTVSSFRVNSKSPLTGIKSCNYLENLLAFEAAKKQGFDEAIRLNEKDEITSACLANIFWKRNNVIHTPTLETGCLSGTTRAFMLGNFAVRECKARLSELRRADKIFLTSAGIGIVAAKLV